MVTAGLASLATSPGPRPPPPTSHATVRGVVEVSTGRPAAAGNLELRIPSDSLPAGPVFVSFETFVIVIRGRPPGRLENDVEASVLPMTVDDGERQPPFDHPQAGPARWRLDCDAGSCQRSFGVLIEWRDAPPDVVAAELEWHVAARVELPPDTPTPLPAVDLQFEMADADARPTVTSASAAGGPVRLSEADRLALWRVSVELPDRGLPDGAGWPVVARAKATLRSQPVVAAATGTSSTDLFLEEVGDHQTRTSVYGDDQIIDFRPFARCVGPGPCQAVYLVGLRRTQFGTQRSSIAPEDVHEAAWDLDVRVTSADGAKRPVEVTVESIEPMPMVSGTIKGTTILGEGATGKFHYQALVETSGEQDGRWDGLPLPTRGLLRATLRSTGSTLIPEGFLLGFGSGGTNTYLGAAELNAGKDVVVEFTPGIESNGARCRVGACDVAGEIDTTIGYTTANRLQPGWQITIEWEMELGVGTTDTSGDATLTIEQIP